MASDVFVVRQIGADISGNQWNNVTHWICTSPTPAPDAYSRAKAINNAFFAAVSAQWSTCNPGNLFWYYTTCRRENNGGGNTAILFTNTVGTFGANITTIGTGALIRLITADPKHQGKIFMPGIAEGMLDADQLNPMYEASVQDYANALGVGFTAALENYVQCVKTKVGYRAIMDYAIAAKAGVQRKRMVPLI